MLIIRHWKSIVEALVLTGFIATISIYLNQAHPYRSALFFFCFFCAVRTIAFMKAAKSRVSAG